MALIVAENVNKVYRTGETEVAGLSRGQGAAFRGEKLGFIFQDFNLIPVLTVYANI